MTHNIDDVALDNATGYEDQAELDSAVSAYCKTFEEWLAIEGGGYSYGEMATHLRDFADFLDKAEARWFEVEGA